jgi:hypothetical protein
MRRTRGERRSKSLVDVDGDVGKMGDGVTDWFV